MTLFFTHIRHNHILGQVIVNDIDLQSRHNCCTFAGIVLLPSFASLIMQYEGEDNRQMAGDGGQKGGRQIVSDNLDDQ